MTFVTENLEEGVGASNAGRPTVDAQLVALGLRRESPPDDARWAPLLDLVQSTYDSLLSTAPAAVTVESLMGAEMLQHRSNYTNLFECAPVPILEHDYDLVVDWMQSLRESGVEDLGEFLEAHPDELVDAIELIRITAVNPEASRLLGAPASELIGPVSRRFIDDGTLPSWRAQLEMIWNGDTRLDAQFGGTRFDGSTFDGLVSMSAPTPFDIPDYSRVVISIRDISEYKSEERRMQELVDAKNHFLASVSHEIRTPLTGVVGFAELLKEDSFESDPDQRRSVVAAIAEQAADVANIVEDLLVAARAELGELDVVAVSVNLTAQVAQVIEAGGPNMDRVITPAREVERRVATADPGRVRQIVRNLLTNAIRYGGPEISVKIHRRASTIFLSVIDDGDGLPTDEWERVFSSYARSHTLPINPGSVGIGLAISRQLARLMGGDLSYRHEDGRSVFELSLPAAPV